MKKSISTKRISRIFDLGDKRSGPFWDLTIIRQWENVHMPFFPNVRVGTCYISQNILTMGHSRWPMCSFDPMTLHSGHSGFLWGHIRFLPLTFDRIKIERWGWTQYVPLAQTHRLICNMTYFSRHVTSRDLDMRSNSDIDLLRYICIYFDLSRREEYDTGKIISLAFILQKLFVKNHFCKNTILTFLDLCSLTRWSQFNSDDVLGKYL